MLTQAEGLRTARGESDVAEKSGKRPDGRLPDDLRPVKIRRHYTSAPAGSVLIEMGRTRVLCTASVEDGVPPFLRDSGRGWVTAEYGMLPGSTARRKPRETAGKVDGRSVEIRRLIGRCMRAAVDLAAIPGRTIWLDCDVLEADGGTRTASITGAYVALADAAAWLVRQKLIAASPLRCMVAAVSVGIVGSEPLLDLCYSEDSEAAVDMNVVVTDSGQFIEVQGTAERGTFGDGDLEALLGLARAGAARLFAAQARSLRWRRRPWE